jgi:ATP-dependent Clp protease adapter protein ClpS
MKYSNGKYKLDEYDMILEEMGYKFKGSVETPVEKDEDTDVDTDNLDEVLNELGISRSKDGEYSLLLWNDDVNDMIHVVLALYEVCQLNNEDAMRVMMEAHNKGKAVAKSGTLEEMNKMKQGLNDRGIEATVEK